LFLTQPVRFFADENGHLAAIECVKMELGEPDARGRRSPVAIPNSNFVVEADTVVLALGFNPYPTIGETTPGLQVKKNGLIMVNMDSMETSRPGIYAGGDAVIGPALVVIAVAHGRQAANSIDAYLKNK
jgi:glutamate synthase (NADPH) small chain